MLGRHGVFLRVIEAAAVNQPGLTLYPVRHLATTAQAQIQPDEEK